MPHVSSRAPGPPPPDGATEGAPAGLESPDPSGRKPHGYFRDAFFGTLAPVSMPVEWSGHQNEVSLRILEADESRQCAHYAYVRSEGHTDSDEYSLAQTIARIAFALDAVDGKPIADECKSLEDRLQLSAELPDTLQDAILEAYIDARSLPISFLAEMREQGAPFVMPPTETGSSSGSVASPSED